MVLQKKEKKKVNEIMRDKMSESARKMDKRKLKVIENEKMMERGKVMENGRKWLKRKETCKENFDKVD